MYVHGQVIAVELISHDGAMYHAFLRFGTLNRLSRLVSSAGDVDVC